MSCQPTQFYCHPHLSDDPRPLWALHFPFHCSSFAYGHGIFQFPPSLIKNLWLTNRMEVGEHLSSLLGLFVLSGKSRLTSFSECPWCQCLNGSPALMMIFFFLLLIQRASGIYAGPCQHLLEFLYPPPSPNSTWFWALLGPVRLVGARKIYLALCCPLLAPASLFCSPFLSWHHGQEKIRSTTLLRKSLFPRRSAPIDLWHWLAPSVRNAESCLYPRLLSENLYSLTRFPVILLSCCKCRLNQRLGKNRCRFIHSVASVAALVVC